MQTELEFLRWIILESNERHIKEDALDRFEKLSRKYGTMKIGPFTVPTETYNEIKSLGRRIHAIKALREATGVGFKEAKEVIEEEFDILRIRKLPE